MSLAHALLMAELLLKAIDNGVPSVPNGPHTPEPRPMDDQTSPAPADATPDSAAVTTSDTTPPDATAAPTPSDPTVPATVPTSVPATAPTTPSGEPTHPSDVQILIGEITQLVQILDKKPELFTFLRALMTK